MRTKFEIGVRGQVPGERRTAMRTKTSARVNRPINDLESLKRRLLAEQLTTVTEEELIRRLQRAADESASLAWATPFPLLALPELLVEKGREARRQFECQRAIWSRGMMGSRMAA